MSIFQKEKEIVQKYIEDFDKAPDGNLISILEKYTSKDYHWRGMHPFYEQDGANDVIQTFWKPFRNSFTPIQRRVDIFFAGKNDCDGEDSTWVVNVGNFLGLFDNDWLGIPSTGKMAFLRYAEFHRVTAEGKIAETTLFCDVISVMHQAGHYPLPPMTGAAFLYPGPRTHDGLLYEEHDPEEAEKTMEVP